MCKKTEKVQRPAGELGLVCKKTEKEFKKEGHERKKTCITCYNLYTHIAAAAVLRIASRTSRHFWQSSEDEDEDNPLWSSLDKTCSRVAPNRRQTRPGCGAGGGTCLRQGAGRKQLGRPPRQETTGCNVASSLGGDADEPARAGEREEVQ